MHIIIRVHVLKALISESILDYIHVAMDKEERDWKLK